MSFAYYHFLIENKPETWSWAAQVWKILLIFLYKTILLHDGSTIYNS